MKTAIHSKGAALDALDPVKAYLETRDPVLAEAVWNLAQAIIAADFKVGACPSCGILVELDAAGMTGAHRRRVIELNNYSVQCKGEGSPPATPKERKAEA